MIDTDNINNIAGTTVYSTDGNKIGSAKQVYLDDQTGRPEWATVNTGLFGTNESFVPLSEATFSGNRLEVPFDKSTIKDAPQVGMDGHLDPAEEQRLYEYYGLATGNASQSDAEYAAARTDAVGTADRDTAGLAADNTLTRSEERLNVGTEQVAVGKARLRKYVVTENVTTTVPVSREEVRIEREPITDANRKNADSAAALSNEEREVTLHAEHPVVNKEAVPVERVRMDTTTLTEDRKISGQVQKEQIDLDGNSPTNATSNRTDAAPART